MCHPFRPVEVGAPAILPWIALSKKLTNTKLWKTIKLATSTQISAASYSKITHTHTQCVHTKQKKTVLLWNALLIEGAVVPATIDQSKPGFDKSQKQKLGRECVCVSILHTHTNRHTCTATALYCCVLCGRLAHCGEMGAVKTLLEKRCWQTEGVWKCAGDEGGDQRRRRGTSTECALKREKETSKVPGKSKRQRMWGKTSLRWEGKWKEVTAETEPDGPGESREGVTRKSSAKTCL